MRRVAGRMSDSAAEMRAKTATAYNAAADFYEHEALSFWDRFGRQTVARMELRPGDAVLDVCCGAGASAIPAAQSVGPRGRVVAVDLAENLLARARTKSRALGLPRLEFRCADLMNLNFPSGAFDAIICVFGLFFVPDMEGAVEELWRMVKPGGKLAITTWGPRLFEPVNTQFWESVQSERADLYKKFNPWDRITDPTAVRELLARSNIRECRVMAEAATHPLRTPDDWWTIILGTGYRGTVEQLSRDAQERVRQANLNYIRENGIAAIEVNVIYALVEKAQ